MWQCPKCGRTFSRKNQHHFCGEAPETIPAYIDRQEEAVRNYLKALYEILNGALPGVSTDCLGNAGLWREEDSAPVRGFPKSHQSLCGRGRDCAFSGRVKRLRM